MWIACVDSVWGQCVWIVCTVHTVPNLSAIKRNSHIHVHKESIPTHDISPQTGTSTVLLHQFWYICGSHCCLLCSAARAFAGHPLFGSVRHLEHGPVAGGDGHRTLPHPTPWCQGAPTDLQLPHRGGHFLSRGLSTAPAPRKTRQLWVTGYLGYTEVTGTPLFAHLGYSNIGWLFCFWPMSSVWVHHCPILPLKVLLQISQSFLSCVSLAYGPDSRPPMAIFELLDYIVNEVCRLPCHFVCGFNFCWSLNWKCISQITLTSMWFHRAMADNRFAMLWFEWTILFSASPKAPWLFWVRISRLCE